MDEVGFVVAGTTGGEVHHDVEDPPARLRGQPVTDKDFVVRTASGKLVGYARWSSVGDGDGDGGGGGTVSKAVGFLGTLQFWTHIMGFVIGYQLTETMMADHEGWVLWITILIVASIIRALLEQIFDTVFLAYGIDRPGSAWTHLVAIVKYDLETLRNIVLYAFMMTFRTLPVSDINNAPMSQFVVIFMIVTAFFAFGRLAGLPDAKYKT